MKHRKAYERGIKGSEFAGAGHCYSPTAKERATANMPWRPTRRQLDRRLNRAAQSRLSSITGFLLVAAVGLGTYAMLYFYLPG